MTPNHYEPEAFFRLADLASALKAILEESESEGGPGPDVRYLCPDGPEQFAVALSRLEDAQQWANRAVLPPVLQDARDLIREITGMRLGDLVSTTIGYVRTDAAVPENFVAKVAQAATILLSLVGRIHAGGILGGDGGLNGHEVHSLGGYASADAIGHDEGIPRQRLSEGKKAGKIRWINAPAFMKDSTGKAVRCLYHFEDAKAYARPKRNNKKRASSSKR